jgi:hypothetical protein
VLYPQRVGANSDRTFLRTIASSNPNLTGWPIWLDSSTFEDRDSRPYVSEGAWETLVASFQGWSTHIDFMRFYPPGKFYLRQTLPDDLSNQVTPGSVMDPIIVVLRVAESMVVGISFAKALGWEVSESKLGFAFRWTNLGGRELSTWSNPLVGVAGVHRAHDPIATTFVEVPLDTPISAIAPYVSAAVRDLFIAFNGYFFPNEAVEYWVQKLATRRL